MTSLTVPLSRGQITSWRNALFVAFGLTGLGFSTWLSRVPAVRDELDVTTSVMGLILLGMAIGSIVGLMVSGYLIERLGATRSVLVGLIVVSFGLPLATVGITIDSIPLTFAGLMVFGVGSGLADVALNVSGAANERMLGRAIMPLYHAMFSVGTVIGAGIGALAESLGVSVFAHCSAIAVVILVGVIVSTRSFQSELSDVGPVAAGEKSHTGWRERLSVWREPRTVLIGLIVLGMAFAEGSANDWLALAMVDGHGLANEQGAVVLGVFLVSMTLGRLAGIPLLDRFGRVPVLRGSAILATVGLLLLIFVPVQWIAIAGTVLWGLGAALGFPVGMSAAADDPRRAASRVSAVAMIGYLAFLAGPPLIGFLGDHIGLLYGLIPVLLLVALAGLASPAARESTPKAP